MTDEKNDTHFSAGKSEPSEGELDVCENPETGDEPSAEQSRQTQSRAAEAVDFREKYLGELADKENMRKRLLREQTEAIRLAAERSALEILAPLDQFENALTFATSMSDEIKNWAVGFQMIHAQFKEWLNRQGITSYQSKGERFTPLLHEAVERIVDNDQPEGMILKEFTRGYRGPQRVIRPARVAVCVHSKAEDAEKTKAVDPATPTPKSESESDKGDPSPNTHHQE